MNVSVESALTAVPPGVATHVTLHGNDAAAHVA
jgi:hypothetical protein